MTAAERNARLRRMREVVGAIARQALADRGLRRVALLDDGGPEAALAARLLEDLGGADAVVRVRSEGGELEPLLQRLAPESGAARAEDELRRLRARLLPGALPAHPANKTALLLGGELPPEPLLPLGDLWASEAAELAGGWSAPDHVARLAEAAGGVGALDDALRGWVDHRDPGALRALPAEVAERVRAAFAAGRASRVFPHVVPKLGTRTLYVDLFE